MKVITKVKQFVSTKSIGEILLIIYCAGLSAIFIYGICKIIYALVIDQSLLQNINFGYMEGI